jgi:hypothetical protein
LHFYHLKIIVPDRTSIFGWFSPEVLNLCSGAALLHVELRLLHSSAKKGKKRKKWKKGKKKSKKGGRWYKRKFAA